MSEEQAGQQEQELVNPVEEKAKLQGWVGKEEYKGDPDKWVDAETFVKRGQDINAVLKERNEHLVKEMQDMKKTFNSFAKFAQKAEERAYKKALEEISKRELQAVADQDIDTYQELQKEKQALEQEKPVVPTQAQQDEHPLMAAFKKKNDWYETDLAMTAEADAMGAAFAQRGMAYPNILAKVEETMKALHPEKFGNSRREQPPAVEFSNDTGLPKKKTLEKTFENLPADAKTACDKYIKAGYVKSREDYVANYEWE